MLPLLSMSAYLELIAFDSTFVGLAVMIACLPIPGYLARKQQEVQRTLMKKTDARVQAATEMMGVIRMIKMFGWERRMSERIDKKRETELQSLWRNKV